jgi:hypothetical protein
VRFETYSSRLQASDSEIGKYGSRVKGAEHVGFRV